MACNAELNAQKLFKLSKIIYVEYGIEMKKWYFSFLILINNID